MIFLAAEEPNVLVTIYGAQFLLQPLTYPEINPDHILAMEDEMGRRILQKHKGKLQKIDFDAQRLPGFPERLKFPVDIPIGSRILLLRGGGIGDMLMCTPAIKAFRHRLPAPVHLTLSTFKSNSLIFEDNPDLDSVIPQPITLGRLLKADYYLEFKDPGRLIHRIHMIDFYLRGVGLDPDQVPDKRPILLVETEKDVFDHYEANRNGYRRIIYLNGLASDPLRDLPPEVLALFPQECADLLFMVPTGYRDRYGDKCAPLFSLSNVRPLDTGHSIQQYISALSASDGIITTDSSAYHLAAGMDKPCMALFGPIDPNLRTTYYPNVITVNPTYHGKTCHSPCGKSMFSEFYNGSTEKQKRCPEAIEKNSQFSPCLCGFPKEQLLEAFEYLSDKVSAG